MAESSWIPEITDEELVTRSKSIKPVVDFPKKGKYYIKEVNLRNIAYTWEPQPTKPATGLKTLQDIRTYHSYGYYGLFKPSVAEVIAQIPKELLDTVVAFEIVNRPESADDLNREQKALNAGYHVATTRLYCHE